MSGYGGCILNSIKFHDIKHTHPAYEYSDGKVREKVRVCEREKV